MSDLGSVPVPDAGITSEQQAPGLVALMSPRAGRVLLTNDVGLLVIERCDGRRTVADLVGEVRASYPDVSAETAEQDVARFLHEAAEKGVVSWQP